MAATNQKQEEVATVRERYMFQGRSFYLDLVRSSPVVRQQLTFGITALKGVSTYQLSREICG